MTLLGREVVEVDALVTDRYLDALMAAGDRGPADEVAAPTGGRRRSWFGAGRARRSESDRLDRGVRLASERLTRDLPRFHPSFRFEERLAVRLAEAAAAMRLPIAAGGEWGPRPEPFPIRDLHPGLETVGQDPEIEHASHPALPLLVGGAVAASALSLAGAAWIAWRRSRVNSSPMARAARAAHALRGRPA